MTKPDFTKPDFEIKTIQEIEDPFASWNYERFYRRWKKTLRFFAILAMIMLPINILFAVWCFVRGDIILGLSNLLSAGLMFHILKRTPTELRDVQLKYENTRQMDQDFHRQLMELHRQLIDDQKPKAK